MNKREEYKWQRSRVRIVYSGQAIIVSYPTDPTKEDWRKEKTFQHPTGNYHNARSFAKEVASELTKQALAAGNG